MYIYANVYACTYTYSYMNACVYECLHLLVTAEVRAELRVVRQQLQLLRLRAHKAVVLKSTLASRAWGPRCAR